jgi:L,D-transpeptidase catalytic domain
MLIKLIQKSFFILRFLYFLLVAIIFLSSIKFLEAKQSNYGYLPLYQNNYLIYKRPVRYLYVDGKSQIVNLIDHGKSIFRAPVSTGLFGFGEITGSNKTPRGWFKVIEKIGTHSQSNSVFFNRKLTGETYNIQLDNKFPSRDWILTRIIRISGLERENNNTNARAIYFHGIPDKKPIGIPGSHGCIRMRNKDIFKLFDLISIETKILIEG